MDFLKPFDTTLLYFIVGIIGIFVALIGQALALREIREKLGRPRKQGTIGDRIQILTSSLKEATDLINHIESEITSRSVLAEKLQKDVEVYNELVELKKPEVEAVAQLLRGELEKERKSTFWKGFAINFLFFVLGAIASTTIALRLK